MRPLSHSDRRALWTALREWSDTGKPVALRTHALVTLAADSGLRASEVVALDARQVLERPTALVIASGGYLRPDQAKGGEVGSGQFTISGRARAALRAWLQCARELQWVPWPALQHSPLFVGHRGHRGAPGHERLSVRASQWAWYELQRRAGLSTRYGFHSLRHDAATRIRAAGADVLHVAAHLRLRDVQHVQRYAAAIDAGHTLRALAERAARL